MNDLERAYFRLACYDRAVQLVRPQPPDAAGKWQPGKPLSIDEALKEAARIEAYCTTNQTVVDDKPAD